MAETIHNNEALHAPSPLLMQKFLAALDREPSLRHQHLEFGAYLSDRISRFTPRALAWSATAAVLAIVIQAALLVGMFVGEDQDRSTQVLSTIALRPSNNSSNLLSVKFTAEATATQVTVLLDALKASVVAGPLPDGTYLIDVGQSSEQIARAARKFQDDSKIIRFVTVIRR